MAAPAAARAGVLAWQHRRSVAWLLAVFLGIPLAIAMMIAVLLGGSVDSAPGQYRPSALALRDIPAPYLRAYQAGAADYGLAWEYVAAIGKIETDHGRSTAVGVTSGVNFAGCCAGPMQFYVQGAGGGTWGAYAVDGNHDGRKNVYDFHDAIPTAAKYLKASGAPKDWDKAIFAYNHASWYVADVKHQAELYRGEPIAAAGLSGTGDPDAKALANNPKITFSHPGPEKADLRSGRISPRLVALLSLITQTHRISIFALASDHKPGTNHEAGRATDIWMVDGDNCYPPNRSGGCWKLAQELARISGCLHPTELIYYFDPRPGFQDANRDGGDDSFAKSDHDDHIHVGYDGPLGPRHYGVNVTPCSKAALTGGG